MLRVPPAGFYAKTAYQAELIMQLEAKAFINYKVYQEKRKKTMRYARVFNLYFFPTPDCCL